jgi:hypothetical protein
MQSDELAKFFRSLSPNGKANFLVRIAHEQTIHARAAYANYASDPTNSDANALRHSNEFIHRLSGYTLQCLHGKTTAEQDMTFLVMILRLGYSMNDLSRWLSDAQNSN